MLSRLSLSFHYFVQKRALAEKAAKKRMMATIGSVKALRSEVNRKMTLAEQTRIQRLLASQEKLKSSGLSGQRLGKHRVPEKDVDVQLGEDLSESLRALKVCYQMLLHSYFLS